MLGGYAGQLNNSDDRVVLQRPAAPPVDQPNFVPHIAIDEVLYDDLAPWPVLAGVGGSSLTRSALDGGGNDAASWTAATPSPGSVDVATPGDANDDGVFDQQDLLQVQQAGKYLSGQPASPLEGDWTGDGLFNQLDIVYVLQRGAYQGSPFGMQRALAGAADNARSRSDQPQPSPWLEEEGAVDDWFATLDR